MQSLADEDLASQALALLGTSQNPDGRCQRCHGMTLDRVKSWTTGGASALGMCLTDLAVGSKESAMRMVNCLRSDPATPASLFAPRKLAWLAAAAQLDWFTYLFKKAYGAAWQDQLSAFHGRVAMPRGGGPSLTQAEFDVVAEWFNRGTPLAEQMVDQEPPPADCVTAVSPTMTSHIATMKTKGWRAVNRERGLLMFGCQGAATSRDCLASYPLARTKPYGAGWESLSGAKLRILRENDYASQFWTRSSADGRFVGMGGAPASATLGASIIDLTTSRVIPTDAAYDPGFFADNSGFMFQTENDGAKTCNLSVLTSAPKTVRLNEPGCASTPGIDLYQHLGVGLNGKDYWTITSEFSNDDGGHDPTLSDPDASFAKTQTAQVTRLVHTGNGYSQGAAYKIEVSYEGDAVISTSATLFASRLAGPNGVPRGYTVRALPEAPTADANGVIQAPEIARYCVPGGKPSFSFDERWMVIHHYVTATDAAELGFTSATDPAFKPYLEKGAANIYLVDLTTGARKRVTLMKPGQYALYPHFRSDGWFYFVVRTAGQTPTETIVASDAALVLAP